MALPIEQKAQSPRTEQRRLDDSNLRRHQTLILSAEALLRQKDAQSQRLRLQNLALQRRLCSVARQNQQLLAWARRSEAVASALRVSLLNVMMQNEAAARGREGFGDSGEIGEEESCCAGRGEMEAEVSRLSCRVCGERRASVLLIPCNHLCVCGECEAAVRECPCCGRTKGGVMKVLL